MKINELKEKIREDYEKAWIPRKGTISLTEMLQFIDKLEPFSEAIINYICTRIYLMISFKFENGSEATINLNSYTRSKWDIESPQRFVVNDVLYDNDDAFIKALYMLRNAKYEYVLFGVGNEKSFSRDIANDDDVEGGPDDLTVYESEHDIYFIGCYDKYPDKDTIEKLKNLHNFKEINIILTKTNHDLLKYIATDRYVDFIY